MSALSEAADRVREAESLLVVAQRERRGLVAEALASGVSPSVIAREAGMHRSAVYQIRGTND